MQRFRNTLTIKNTTILLIMVMSVISLVPRVDASFIPSSGSKAGAMRDQDLTVITKALENKMVKQRLQDLGFSEQEIQDRLSQLSDQEVHQLALQIDSLTQGGHMFGVVIAVLLIVVLVLVILKLT